jgi:hypothetical protein
VIGLGNRLKRWVVCWLFLDLIEVSLIVRGMVANRSGIENLRSAGCYSVMTSLFLSVEA